MKLVLIGAGSIGGMLSVLLAEKGIPLDVVVHGEEKAKLIRQEGFHLTGVRGEHCAKLNTFGSVSELEDLYDVCIIATKYQQMPELAKEMIPHLKPDALVLAMQNGNCMDQLAAAVGVDRTVGCMISFSATLKSANEAEVTAVDKLILGMADGTVPDRLKALAEVLNKAVPTRVTDHLLPELYAKIIFNSCINAISSVTYTNVGHMLSTPKARQVILGIIREGVAVTEANGIEVAPYNVLPPFQFFANHRGPLADALLGRFLQLALSVAAGKVRPSTLQSLEKGLPTEIDIMNGHLAALGTEHGIPTPVNTSLTRIIKEIEHGDRSLDAQNIQLVELK